jgi:chromate reductase, NAD(P)H dehydrogenase (quinone)
MTTTTVIGLSGSLRQGSYNSALLRAMAELTPPELTIDIQSIRGIPLYDGDVEKSDGIPAVVEDLKDRIARADGLLLVSPEYNNGIPGVFKNAIDWLTRPPKDIARVFADKPVGLAGVTPGRGGTRIGQTAWLPIFRTLGMRPFWGNSLYLAGATNLFDDQLHLTDDKIRDLVKSYLGGFSTFVAGQHR